jgi:hypothetical protein
MDEGGHLESELDSVCISHLQLTDDGGHLDSTEDGEALELTEDGGALELIDGGALELIGDGGALELIDGGALELIDGGALELDFAWSHVSGTNSDLGGAFDRLYILGTNKDLVCMRGDRFRIGEGGEELS